ncbi:MAG: class I SAM-dependent rRNA methyltransferase [Paramuribaculum sp.]|nr:class I SAM-dependent rRNA methyltransferase [Paramuribaculum sp.]
MNYDIIRLKKGKEESLRRFHPWVFSGAIASMPPELEEGTIVTVLSYDGNVLGTGHYQKGSIAVRMLRFDDAPIDSAFYSDRIAEAWNLRKAAGIINDRSDCYRLIHGEGDFLPGLIVDVYGATAVMQAHSPGIHLSRKIIAESLVNLPGLGLKNIFYKSETTLPFKAGLEPADGYLIGNFETDVAKENGLLFHVDWLKGQKTGFFIDQRDNRALLRQYSCGKDVLNMFCYTGGFSVYALKGGARKVVSVDSSAKAVSLTERNISLNFPESAPHTAIAMDAFKYLDDMADGEFDLIVLDPPAFAKHRSAIPNALRGYQKLNLKAFKKIRRGGIVFTFSCSQAISKEQFRLAVLSAAVDSGRKVRILHQLTQPADHPVNIYHPEGEYLKGLVLHID